MIEVVDSKTEDDGSETITFEMDQETLIIFAKKGILHTLKEYVEKSKETDWGKPEGKEVW